MTRRSQLRYFQISLRRFGRPARIDQYLCKATLEIDEFSVGGRGKFQGPTIKGRRSIKSQCARGFPGSDGGVSGGAHSLTCSQVVFEERFGVVNAAGFEGLGQPAVNLCNSVRRELVGESFADAIVIQLKGVPGSASAQKLRGAQGGDQRQLVPREFCGLISHFRINRASGHWQRV